MRCHFACDTHLPHTFATARPHGMYTIAVWRVKPHSEFMWQATFNKSGRECNYLKQCSRQVSRSELGQLPTVQSFRDKSQPHTQHFMASSMQLSAFEVVLQQCSCVPGHHALATWTAALAGCSEGGRPSGWRPANRLKILSNARDAW